MIPTTMIPPVSVFSNLSQLRRDMRIRSNPPSLPTTRSNSPSSSTTSLASTGRNRLPLPEVVLARLAIYLAPSDLLALAATSKPLHGVLNEHGVWRSKVAHDFPSCRWALNARTHPGWAKEVYRGLHRSSLLMWSDAMDIALHSPPSSPSSLPMTMPAPRPAGAISPHARLVGLDAVAGMHLARDADDQLWRINTSPRLTGDHLNLPFVPVSWSTGTSHVLLQDADSQVWELHLPSCRSPSPLALRLKAVRATQVSASVDLSALLTSEGEVHVWPADSPELRRAITASRITGSTSRSLRCWSVDSHTRALPPIPTQPGEEILKIAAGRGIVLALTSFGRVFLQYVTSARQEKPWTHLPYYSSPYTTSICVHERAIATFAAAGPESKIVRFGMVGEWSLGLGGHLRPKVLDLGAPIVQVALGDDIQAALTSRGEVYTWSLQAQMRGETLVRWGITAPVKRSVVWDACSASPRDEPFVFSLAPCHGLRSSLWMLGFAPEKVAASKEQKRSKMRWGVRPMAM